MGLPKMPKGKTGNYLKLKDGESAVGLLVTEGVKFKWIRWENNKSVTTDEDDPDAKCRATLHFIHKQDKDLVPMLFEMSYVMYERLEELEVMGHDLNNTWVQVKRKGSTQFNTKWSVDAAPNGSVDEAARKTINLILSDLGLEMPGLKTEAEDDVPL